jgi:hypothetical protein
MTLDRESVARANCRLESNYAQSLPTEQPPRPLLIREGVSDSQEKKVGPGGSCAFRWASSGALSSHLST